MCTHEVMCVHPTALCAAGFLWAKDEAQMQQALNDPKLFTGHLEELVSDLNLLFEKVYLLHC